MFRAGQSKFRKGNKLMSIPLEQAVELAWKATRKEERNLCDSCIHNFADCLPAKIEFGHGYGEDNVVLCTAYEKREGV